MIFRIRRTSVWDPEVKPHEAAFRAFVPRYDIRTCTEEEYNDRIRKQTCHKDFSKPWREYGTEHTVDERGYIKRRLPDHEVWAVKIESLEELLAFAGNGELVISGSEPPSIEIYDDYRE